jgi:hypothetical protein
VINVGETKHIVKALLYWRHSPFLTISLYRANYYYTYFAVELNSFSRRIGLTVTRIFLL